MIGIAISKAAYEAIARTLSLGTMGFEQALNANGDRFVWLEPSVIDRLAAMRGSGRTTAT